MYYKYIFFFSLILFGTSAYSQIEHDFLYFKNFVSHSEGDLCTHIPPQASFVAYLNGDQTNILLENAPRWEIGADPNITGMGVFGVEFGNFNNPTVSVGDSAFVRFTCRKTGQQGILVAYIDQIPYIYFPTMLSLRYKNLPPTPVNLRLEITSDNFRHLSWDSQPNTYYQIYRRMVRDTVFLGQSRRLYLQIAQDISGSSYVDTTGFIEPHGYILIPKKNGIFGPHSLEVVDFPSTPNDPEAAVAYYNPFEVAVTWIQKGDTTGLTYKIYRAQNPTVSIDSIHFVGETTRLYWLDSLVTGGETYYYRIIAVNPIGISSEPSDICSATIEQFANGLPDLDILYISRSPKYPRYEVEYNPPGYNPFLKPGTQNLKHYPDTGDLIKHSAVIRNSGGGTVENYIIQWYVDSVLVMSENREILFPRQKVLSQFHNIWSESVQTISCRINQRPLTF